MLDVLRRLGDRFTLTIVSNTHDVNLVQSHLSAMGADHSFETAVDSIDVGRRKPHPVICEAALDTLWAGPADALFVADTHLAHCVGPECCGIRAFLIDPERRAHVPGARRIDSLLQLAGHRDDQGLT